MSTAYMMYKENPFAPLFLINGEAMPWYDDDGNYYVDTYNGVNRGSVCNPGRDYVEKSEQLVRSTRNANGEVIAEVINRRMNKFDNLYWPYLSAKSVTWLKRQIAKFSCTLTYWDSELDAVISRDYYWGDFEATPCEWQLVSSDGIYMKKPKYYKDVKCNLIDKRILIQLNYLFVLIKQIIRKEYNYGVRTKVFECTIKARSLFRNNDVCT